MVLGSVNIVLVTKDAGSTSVCSAPKIFMLSKLEAAWIISNAPDGHARAGNTGELDGAGETLVALGIVVFEADLELDSLEEIPLLLVVGVVEQ